MVKVTPKKKTSTKTRIIQIKPKQEEKTGWKKAFA